MTHPTIASEIVGIACIIGVILLVIAFGYFFGNTSKEA